MRVEAAAGGGTWVPALEAGRPVDDGGYHVGLFHLGGAARGHRYAARWYTGYLGPDRSHRFVVVPNSGRPELVSADFG